MTEQNEKQSFVPNYAPLAGRRVYRSRLRADEGGVATVAFRGQVDPSALWVERTRSGVSLYAEVAVDDVSLTEIKVALVPTGKRVPADTVHLASPAKRIGSAGRVHVYLLDVDPTADRAAFDAAYEARKAEEAALRAQREAEAAAAYAALVGDDGDADGVVNGGWFIVAVDPADFDAAVEAGSAEPSTSDSDAV